jgi:ubiquinone/menaquinone biosynthesis C-methylase UbiE
METNEAVLEQRQEKKRTTRDHHVCPWWIGYLLCCPLRKFMENPKKILGSHIQPGMTVVEPGSGMGYFTLPMARMVGPEGRVVCVDIEKRMLSRLEKRARKAGLADRIDTHLCNDGDLGLQTWEGKVDLVAAIHVIHEVPDQSAFLDQVYKLLKPSSRLLVLEPKGHVDAKAFEATLDQAKRIGFEELEPPTLKGERTALLEKR